MPGQRGTGARRSRGSWAVRIAGIALVLVAAVTVASILVFAQGTARRCLTAAASPAAPSITLARCNLGLSQRWRHQFVGKDTAGRNNWRLRSAADGRCLTAVRPPLGAQPGESGVGLRVCGPSVTWRQIVSFRTAY